MTDAKHRMVENPVLTSPGDSVLMARTYKNSGFAGEMLVCRPSCHVSLTRFCRETSARSGRWTWSWLPLNQRLGRPLHL